MKIRKYRVLDPTQMQLCNDIDGEFLHVNDIELLFMKEKHGLKTRLEQLKINDESSDWHKQYAKELQANIELLEYLESAL